MRPGAGAQAGGGAVVASSRPVLGHIVVQHRPLRGPLLSQLEHAQAADRQAHAQPFGEGRLTLRQQSKTGLCLSPPAAAIAPLVILLRRLKWSRERMRVAVGVLDPLDTKLEPKVPARFA